MKIDCLLEVTAEFFYAGDKACTRELEDIICWKGNACGYDLTKGLPRSTEVDVYSHEPDCEFIENTIGFTWNVVSEGRRDDNHGCGIEFETEHVGNDWFMECHEDWTADAILLKQEIEKPKVDGLNRARDHREQTPVRVVRWLVAAGYWSSYDSYTREHDGGVEVYGRVRLSDIQQMLQQKLFKLGESNVSTDE